MTRLLEAAAEAAAARGKPAPALADMQRELPWSWQRLHNWTRRGISKEGALDAQRRYGCSADYVLTGAGPKVVAVDQSGETSPQSTPSQLVRFAAWQSGSRPQPRAVSLDDNPDLPVIPLVQFKLSAGASGFSVDYLEDEADPITFRRQWFDAKGFDPSKLFAIRVMNGSMEPGLWHGDVVVVNTADTAPRDGAVFAVNYEGELVIKRLIRDEGRWWLKSDNPDQMRYPRKACDEGVFIIGRVVHKQSENI